MAMPGAAITQGLSSMNSRPLAAIEPHSGHGGWAPRPRKPRPAAVMMMPAMLRVTRTITEGMHIGRMWRVMIAMALAPCRRTAAM